MYPSEPFPHFVDDYLAYLYEVHPTQASLDGVHLHDDLLEDLSRSGIEADLHENPWRLFDVFAGGLNKAGNLTQFRRDAPRSLRFRGI